MPRPDIPNRQTEQVESLHETVTGYEAKNFQEALWTVISLANKGLKGECDGAATKFNVEVEEVPSGTNVVVSVTDNSNWTFEYFEKGDPPHTAILDTGISWVGENPIVEALQEISGVENAYVEKTTGTITAEIDEAVLNAVAAKRSVKKKIETLVDEFDSKVLEGVKSRKETREDAIYPYWKHIK